MKYTLILSLFLSCFSVAAQVVEWADIELDQKLTLTQEILFANEGIVIAPETHVEVTDIIGLPIDVELYQVKMKKCAFPSKTAEMILLEPFQQTDRSVGIQLKENCILEIFVELKDLYSKSLFKNN